MKRVGIMTFHGAYNYGAVLQAYALQTTINHMGYDCEMINFRPKRQKGQYGVIDTQTINKVTLVKSIYNLFHAGSIIERNRNYESFISDKLNLNPKTPIDEEAVEQVAAAYDYIVCGSDQIWNMTPKMNDRSMRYFLDFSHRAKGISYAASFGDGLEDAEKNAEKILPLICQFASISVREKDAAVFLEKHGVKSEVVADPTLLLDEEAWQPLIGEKKIQKPYVLYYSVNSRPYSIHVTKRIAAGLGLEVINPVLHPKALGSGFKYHIAGGPADFLALVKNASFVCTNSFHGTIFSIVFQKPFVSIFATKNGEMVRENRKASLLEQLGLEHHMCTEHTEVRVQDLLKLSYVEAFNKLEGIKAHSLAFLKNSLG